MLLLGIDTSGKSGGVTLAEGDETSFRVFESVPIAGGTFSAQLVPTVAALLERHGIKPREIEGFAVASGPGSFTGLRVGLAAVKGLAETLHKPIATVSLLEALASYSQSSGPITAIMDAGRGELFVGVYFIQPERQGLTRIAESLRARAEFTAELEANGPHAVVTCDDSVAEFLAPAGLALERVPRPESERIAQLGLKKLLRGDVVPVEALDANYLRRSDAEIFFREVKT